jgi:hypothetical protein
VILNKLGESLLPHEAPNEGRASKRLYPSASASGFNDESLIYMTRVWSTWQESDLHLKGHMKSMDAALSRQHSLKRGGDPILMRVWSNNDQSLIYIWKDTWNRWMPCQGSTLSSGEEIQYLWESDPIMTRVWSTWQESDLHLKGYMKSMDTRQHSLKRGGDPIPMRVWSNNDESLIYIWKHKWNRWMPCQASTLSSQEEIQSNNDESLIQE